MLEVVAILACATAWGIRVWQRRLADDRGQFFTHEEMAERSAFLRQVALQETRQAEAMAAARGPEHDRWAAEAKAWRLRAAALERSESGYRWRADLKQQLSRGGW